MKFVILSVFDVAAGVFQRPFISIAKGEAIRSWSDVCADVSHPFGQHPEDYTLFQIGMFDDANGDLMDFVNEKVITGLEAAQVGQKPPSGEEVGRTATGSSAGEIKSVGS